MKVPIKKNLSTIQKEDAHAGAGQRQVLFSKSDSVSSPFEAWTKGFLPAGGCYDWHEHQNIDEYFIVIQGKGFIEYSDGTKFDYSTDDIFFNPANLSHRIVNQGDKESIFYFIRMNA